MYVKTNWAEAVYYIIHLNRLITVYGCSMIIKI